MGEQVRSTDGLLTTTENQPPGENLVPVALSWDSSRSSTVMASSEEFTTWYVSSTDKSSQNTH
jgi:hypothetical protein